MRPKPDDIVGGKYRVLRLIGDGGMGTVYEARHQVLRTRVALKFLHSDLVKRPGLAERFTQEARVSASIQSPHVVRVTDVDTTEDGTPYLVMEFLTGETLQAVLDRERKVSKDVAVDFGLQILNGLEEAHALGIVHRDLKPENVFITEEAAGPLLKLIDFGIAKLRASSEYTRGLTRAGVMLGTPEYMAPEQLYGADKVDHRADIYSLGALLYEMLAGVRPADGQDAAEIVGRVVTGNVQRLESLEPLVGKPLADVIHRAMAVDATERFDTAHAMRLALIPFAGRESHAGRLSAAPASASPRLGAAAAQEPASPRLGAAAAQEPGVPATWPDEQPVSLTKPATAQEPPQVGSTQGVSPEEIRRSIELSLATRAPRYPAATNQSLAYVPTPRPSGVMAARRPKRALGAVFAILLGVLVTGAGIAAVVAVRNQRSDEVDSPAMPPEVVPQTTISAETHEPPPQARPDVLPPPATPSRGNTTPRGRSDTGAKGSADAGTPNPFPFQLPSAFPTAFPTAFPPIPGFPAAAPSAQPLVDR
jgi:serine/threonine-protein kinase